MISIQSCVSKKKGSLYQRGSVSQQGVVCVCVLVVGWGLANLRMIRPRGEPSVRAWGGEGGMWGCVLFFK